MIPRCFILQMTINFPMPPALQLLQGLLERAEERHRQRREAGETSSESSDSESDEEEGGQPRAERPKKEKKKKGLCVILLNNGHIPALSTSLAVKNIGQ